MIDEESKDPDDLGYTTIDIVERRIRFEKFHSDNDNYLDMYGNFDCDFARKLIQQINAAIEAIEGKRT